MTDTPLDTSKALRIALAQRNMSRKELAERIGITQNHMSRLSTGSVMIQGETLNKIAAALLMKASEFLALGED